MLFLLMNPNYTNINLSLLCTKKETKQLLTEFSITVYNEIKFISPCSVI